MEVGQKGMSLKIAHNVRNWLNDVIKLQPSMRDSRANVFTRREVPSGGHYAEEYSVVLDLRIQIHNVLEYDVVEAWINMFADAMKQVHERTEEETDD